MARQAANNDSGGIEENPVDRFDHIKIDRNQLLY